MEQVSRPLPSFVGPLSLVGSCLGLLAWLVPALYGGATLWLLLAPALGVVLVLLPRARLRHLGLGLVSSVLVWPFTILGVALLASLTDIS